MRLSSTSVRIECLPRKFVKTSWKPLRRSLLLIAQWKKWAAEFTSGRETVDDDGRSGHPKDATADENVKLVHTLFMCDRRLDLRSIASEVGLSWGAVQSILTNISGMSKVSARWVPRMLTDDQKRTSLDISWYLLSRYEDDHGDFIEWVVLQDETWVHHFDPVKNAEQTMETPLSTPS